MAEIEPATYHSNPSTRHRDCRGVSYYIFLFTESISHSGSFSPYENKEVVKLKLELLKYQLETAKVSI